MRYERANRPPPPCGTFWAVSYAILLSRSYGWVHHNRSEILRHPAFLAVDSVSLHTGDVEASHDRRGDIVRVMFITQRLVEYLTLVLDRLRARAYQIPVPGLPMWQVHLQTSFSTSTIQPATYTRGLILHLSQDREYFEAMRMSHLPALHIFL